MFLGYSARAQSTPQFLVSWQAESLVPFWYKGKTMPAGGNATEVRFELIDGGRIADISNLAVRWYINDKLVINENKGLGIKSLIFNNPDFGGQETEVRILIVGYKGISQTDKLITIPITGQEVVINNQRLGRNLKTGENKFEAIPFFFSAKNENNLSAKWLANGSESSGVSDSPFELNLNIESNSLPGTKINLSVLVKNLLKEIEFANESIQLEIQ